MSEGKIVPENHVYQTPSREIVGPMDMQKWKNSEAYHEYRGFLCALNEAVKRKPISSTYHQSPSVQIFINLLNELDSWIEKFPPIQQQQRFGNQAFRSWYLQLEKDGKELLKKHLPEKFHGAIIEIFPYFLDGFGNSTRIDYGTGHEMSFLWLLSCLFKIGFFAMEDKCAVALKIFDRNISHLIQRVDNNLPSSRYKLVNFHFFLVFKYFFSVFIDMREKKLRQQDDKLQNTKSRHTIIYFVLENLRRFMKNIQSMVVSICKPIVKSGYPDNGYLWLVRKLQTTYRMEPAGSRGVWSLDDFQFIPFFWGSSQLIDHQRIEPKSFLQPEVVEGYYKDYLFLSCIHYINSVKSGPFFEHSNQLYHVSGVASWDKVNQGLLRMYDDHVLNKFPVVQHIVFGSLMGIKPSQLKPQQGPPRHLPKVDPSKLPPPRATE